MPTPSSYATKSMGTAKASFPKAKGAGKPKVVRRGGNTAIPATYCEAKRAAFKTGTRGY